MILFEILPKEVSKAQKRAGQRDGASAGAWEYGMVFQVVCKPEGHNRSC